MGKKRVYELAKELGLENKEVVERLQAAGIAVTSHSSSVYEEEALAALGKGPVKAEEPAPAKRRPGMMLVRKKKATDEAESTDAVALAEQPASAELGAVTEPAEPAEEPPFSEGELPVEPEVEGVEAVDAADDGGAPDAIAEEPGIVEAAGPSAGDDGAAPAASEAAEATAAPATTPAKPERPGVSAKVVRMIDREKLLERVPQRRLGGGPPAQRFGKVTELAVVTDPFGGQREMVDVDQNRRRGPGAKVPKKGRAPTKREMVEMRERAMNPSRLKKKKVLKRAPKKTELTQPKASKRVIKMKEKITVADLAHQLGVKAMELLRRLMDLGMMVSLNDSIDLETAQMLAGEHNYVVESVAFAEEVVIAAGVAEENPEDLQPRPPVVTVMGHVDHGKTSLLDTVRKTKVVDGEAGGITQHIGAYQVKVPKRGLVTFLDTPGHAAFTNMRARGAKVTDIVVLVVAADDGVMPQTEEAIRHAQAAEVPIVVAINKIDKPEAQPDRVINELSKFNLVSEAWGGDTLMIKTSATKGSGVNELLDAILLQAEMLELSANPKRPAEGVVIEAKLDKGRGPVATVLVQRGTLKRGDAVVVGGAHGKIRAMADATGQQRGEAGPATPVEITGLDIVPDAGDTLNAVESLEAAREVASHRQAAVKATDTGGPTKLSLEELMARMQGGENLELKIILKADVKGSVEAVRDAVAQLSTEEVKVSVVHGGVGTITESDIMLATASGAILVGFNVRPDTNARAVAERAGVEIRTYRIIYELLEDIRKAQEGLLAPETKETLVGHAEVREVFKVSKVGVVGGCRVKDGKAVRSAKVRIVRDGVPVYEGRIGSLKHFKDDVREVEAGQECGISIDGYLDIKQGDVFEFFQVEVVARKLTPSPTTRRPGGAEAHP